MPFRGFLPKGLKMLAAVCPSPAAAPPRWGVAKNAKLLADRLMARYLGILLALTTA